MAELTPRERQILAMVAAGDSNPEIGAALFLAETTIKTHMQRLCAKLGARNRVHAVTVAHQLGLLDGGLVDRLRAGVAIGIGDMGTCPCATPMCADCVAGIAAEVLRELLKTERV